MALVPYPQHLALCFCLSKQYLFVGEKGGGREKKRREGEEDRGRRK